jgi:hypothetical protein
MIRRIYLDLDDVCNTFTPCALNAVGCPIGPTDYSKFPIGSPDIVDAANILLKKKQHTDKSFWTAIKRTVWSTTPESDFFPWLLEICEQYVGRKNICIATSPTLDPECLAGKLEWIHEHLPEWMRRQYAITPRKFLLARGDSVLIDDCEDNIQNFEDNGGHGILVPRPWNHLRCFNPKDSLARDLERMF